MCNAHRGWRNLFAIEITISGLSMKNFLIKSIIIFITITFTGSTLYISDKSKTQVKNKNEFQLRQNELDKFYSNKKLGSFVEEGKTYFRLFTPNAEKVYLTLIFASDSKSFKIPSTFLSFQI